MHLELKLDDGSTVTVKRGDDGKSVLQVTQDGTTAEARMKRENAVRVGEWLLQSQQAIAYM